MKANDEVMMSLSTIEDATVKLSFYSSVVQLMGLGLDGTYTCDPSDAFGIISDCIDEEIVRVQDAWRSLVKEAMA